MAYFHDVKQSDISTVMNFQINGPLHELTVFSLRQLGTFVWTVARIRLSADEVWATEQTTAHIPTKALHLVARQTHFHGSTVTLRLVPSKKFH